MTAELVSEWARGRLANYDGETIGVLAVDGDGAAAAADTMAFVSEVVAYEIDRGTTLATVDQVGSVGVLNVASALLDTSAGTPAGVWFYDNSTGADATRRLLSFLPTIEAAGFVDWPAAAPNGIGTWRAAAPTTTTTAASVAVDATGFTGNLSGTDTDVQTALETIDAMTVGGGGGASDVFPCTIRADAAAPLNTGSFTSLDAIDVDGNVSASIARATLVGYKVFVKSGANMGVWTVTASGACTFDATQPAGSQIVTTQSAGAYIGAGLVTATAYAEMTPNPLEEDVHVAGDRFTGTLAALDDSASAADVFDIVDGLAAGGDVVGPASSTDGHLALFDGTSGKLIKDGGAVTAAGLALLTGADAAAQRTTLGLNVLGGQDEGTAVTSTSDTTLLDSTPTISGLVAGDVVVFDFATVSTNTSGSGRTHTIKPKLGATTLGTLSFSAANTSGASTAGRVVVRAEGTSDQNVAAHLVASNSGGTPVVATVSTENLSSGVAFNLLGAIGAGGSQSITLQYLAITRYHA